MVIRGADADAERRDQLFDAALGELSVMARRQLCMLVGDFNVEPTKIPCLAKGISAGLWVDLEVSWASATGKQPSSTCVREWGSGGGTRRDFMIGCPLAAAAVLSCTVQADRWISPHLAVWTFFGYGRWSCRASAGSGFLLSGLLLGCVLLIRVGGLSLLRSRGFGRYIIIVVWSSAAETALADAYRFSGGPLPNQGLVIGRGMARFRLVRLGRGIGFGRFVVMLLMFMMLLMSSCIVTLLLPFCLI